MKKLNNGDKWLQVGDVVDLRDGHTVYADVPEHTVYANRGGSMKLTHREVKIGSDPYIAGKYLVYMTTYGGGGAGHGPFDVYPNGHHVWCCRLDDRSVVVDFYQSGCFTAMINILPVGRCGVPGTMQAKKCRDCGRFVRKDRWVPAGEKNCQAPLCDRCLGGMDPEW